MLVVKIEVWPGGIESRKREIGRTYIGNVGDSSDPSRGDYEVAVCRRNVEECPWPHGTDTDRKKKRPKPTRTGEVKNYPRLSYNVWRLILRSLLSCFPEEQSKICKRCESDPTVLDEIASKQLYELLENPPPLPDWVREELDRK